MTSASLAVVICGEKCWMSTGNPVTASHTETDSICSSVPPDKLANAAPANKDLPELLDHPALMANLVLTANPVLPVMLEKMPAKTTRSVPSLSSAPADLLLDLPDLQDLKVPLELLAPLDPMAEMVTPDPTAPLAHKDPRELTAKLVPRDPMVTTAQSFPLKTCPPDLPVPPARTDLRDLPVTLANPEMPDPTARTVTMANEVPMASPETPARTVLLANPAVPAPRAPATTAHRPDWPPAISRLITTLITATMFLSPPPLLSLHTSR